MIEALAICTCLVTNIQPPKHLEPLLWPCMHIYIKTHDSESRGQEEAQQRDH